MEYSTYQHLGFFDEGYDTSQQLPRRATFKIEEPHEGKVVVSVKLQAGTYKNLGFELTDQSPIDDKYRFHDVLHLSNMAVLRWSPVLRWPKFLNCRRQASPEDMNMRGYFTEELMVISIFEDAKDFNYFEGASSINTDLLRKVESLIKSFEVRACTRELLQRAFLDGFAIFRRVCENRGGYIQTDMTARSVVYIGKLEEEEKLQDMVGIVSPVQ